MTGMDTRIGYPNEHLAPGTPDEMASPMYATGIGLVIQGIERYLREKVERKTNSEMSRKTPDQEPSCRRPVLRRIEKFKREWNQKIAVKKNYRKQAKVERIPEKDTGLV